MMKRQRKRRFRGGNSRSESQRRDSGYEKKSKQDFIISSGTDEAEEGKWVWASDGQVFHENGQPVERVFTNWAGGSAPAPKISVAENCLVMPKSGANEGKWQDKSCQGKAVACEAKVVVGIAHYLDDLDDVK